MFGDIYNIADRIKAIDKNFRIIWSKTRHKYFIYHKNALFMESEKLDHELYNHIKKVVYINVNGDIQKDIEETNDKIERDKEKKISNLAEDVAREISKPLKDILY